MTENMNMTFQLNNVAGCDEDMRHLLLSKFLLLNTDTTVIFSTSNKINLKQAL